MWPSATAFAIWEQVVPDGVLAPMSRYYCSEMHGYSRAYTLGFYWQE